MNHASFSILAAAAADPHGYAAAWKARTGRQVIGFLPMNFPPELLDAAGVLPWQLQVSRRPITIGNSVFPTFYCGFTRSIVDQAVCGNLAFLDALYFVDNCVQLIGAADVVRAKLRALRVRYFQIDPSMKTGSSSRNTAGGAYAQQRADLETLTGRPVSDEALAASIGRFNQSRALLREVHALRLAGSAIAARDLQVLVSAAMVMERADYNRELQAVVDHLKASSERREAGPVRVHLSGHMCHAPKAELLDLIEDCGAQVVNDDLYHGLRYYATDITLAEGGDPMDALVNWYFTRNHVLPCPTRTHAAVRWDRYLADAAGQAQAEGVITLLAKFCEPHMFLVPEISETLERESIPHLLVETELEGMPLESIRTRVESFVESIRSRRGSRRTPPVSRIKENA